MRMATIIIHKPALAAISMGFNGFHLFCIVFAWVLKWYPLKPMQIIGSPYSHLLKPMCITAKTQNEVSKAVKTHAPVHKRLAKKAAEHTTHTRHTHVDPSSREAQR